MTDPPRPTVALFGGSFDPPHSSHVLLAAYVLSSAPVDRMIVVPTWQHALDKRVTAPYADRFRMCELAFTDLRRVEISAIERELAGKSYTLRTVEALRERLPDTNLRLALGSDILAETARWHRFDRVCELAPLIVVGRSGYALPGRSETALPLPAVSSTEIRERIRHGISTAGLVPTDVARYIQEAGLYGSGEDT